MSLLFHSLPVLPLSLKYGPLIVKHRALSMHPVICPFALKAVSPHKPHLAKAMPFVIFPRTFILISIRIVHLPLAMPFSVDPLTSIDSEVLVSHPSIAMRKLGFKLAFIPVSVRKQNRALTLTLLEEFPFNHRTIRSQNLALCEHIPQPLSLPPCSILKSKSAFALSDAIGKIAFKNSPLAVHLEALAMHQIVSPLPVVE